MLEILCCTLVDLSEWKWQCFWNWWTNSHQVGSQVHPKHQRGIGRFYGQSIANNCNFQHSHYSLLGGWATPLKKYEFVSDEIPKIYGKITFMFQTTNQSWMPLILPLTTVWIRDSTTNYWFRGSNRWCFFRKIYSGWGSTQTATNPTCFTNFSRRSCLCHLINCLSLYFRKACLSKMM